MAVRQVEELRYSAEDFQPVVESSGGWLVALMNWSPRFDLSGWGVLERHPQTDEVFVLLKGRSVLISHGDGDLQWREMAPGVVYNVTAGTWHNVLGTRDVQWLIVESRPALEQTPEQITQFRDLGAEERAGLLAAFPAWLHGG